jgi:uncharacterized protein YebE (UPF0316 family)
MTVRGEAAPKVDLIHAIALSDMILFLVGIVDMVVIALWTKAVTKANVPLTGLVTTLNVFIWYYVVSQVVEHIDDWATIVPYAAGCAIGSMIGALDRERTSAMMKKIFAAVLPRAKRHYEHL